MLGILGALLFSTTATLESDTRVQLPPSHQLMIAGPVQALTDEQFIVAEAWHLVDRKFVDHAQIQNDWNKLRLKYLRRSYRSMDDAHQAIRDMLRTLGDPYTRFLSPAEYNSLLAAARGELVGIGIELAPPRIDNSEDKQHATGTSKEAAPPGRVSVAAVLDASPAALAGIRPDDEILLVDGEETGGLSPDEVAARIRGEADSFVRLRIHRRGEREPRDLVIKRTPLRLDALLARGPDPEGVAYIRIRQFNENTAEELRAAVERMAANQSAPLQLVVDLRSNPGGYFPDGVDAARLFLPKDRTVVYTVDAKDRVKELHAQEDGPLLRMVQSPVWVLIDRGTASASEIFAVALHDNDEAKLIGSCSFGKGVIQTVQGLRDGSAVAITTARYETPKHENINKRGVCPDIVATCKAPPLNSETASIRDALACLPR